MGEAVDSGCFWQTEQQDSLRRDQALNKNHQEGKAKDQGMALAEPPAVPQVQWGGTSSLRWQEEPGLPPAGVDGAPALLGPPALLWPVDGGSGLLGPGAGWEQGSQADFLPVWL